MTAPLAASVREVFARDEGCCARCGTPITGTRGVDFSIHHRRPRGSGGTSLAWVNLPANLLLLCGSGTTGCHGWVETNRSAARDDGFLVPLNGRFTAAESAIRHHVLGYVFLDDQGGHRAA